MAFPFGRWVMIDRLPEEPIVAFVYLDQHAGPSAKGGLDSEAQLATMPSRTVRLSPQTALRELTDDEVRSRKLPAKPAWLSSFGPQPTRDAPWRNDPHLAGKFHPQFPDDLQALVHDGDPRRMRRGPELCWVRIQRVENGVYIAALLNQPHTLQSVKKGDAIKLLSVAGMPHPLHVTEDYLRERRGWQITPCDRCGASECFDPPTVMAQVRFPNAAPGDQIQAFTSFCPNLNCGGSQQLMRL